MSQLLPRKFWTADSSVATCYECRRAFSMFIRKHHCRMCGNIFCNKCSNYRLSGEKYGSNEPIRVCKFCFNKISSQYHDSPMIQKKVQTENANHSDNNLTLEQQKNIRENNRSWSYFKENNQTRASTSDIVWKDSGTRLDSLLAESQEISTPESIQDDDESGIIKVTRIKSAQNPLMTPDLIELDPPTNQSTVEEDLFNLPRSTRRTSAVASFMSLFEDKKKPEPKLIRRESSLLTLDKNLIQKISWESMSYEEKLGFRSEQYLTQLINKILTHDYKISLSWNKLLINLSNEVISLLSHLSDTPMQRVKIYIIPGGKINECKLINGIAFRHRVAHKHMQSYYKHPRILLFSFPFEFEIVHGKLSELTTIYDLEEEHLKKHVERVVKLKPDIIISQSNFSRIALELFLKERITVICNVSKIIIEKIAHTTGIGIIKTMRELTILPPTPNSLMVKNPFSIFSSLHYMNEDGSFDDFLFFDGSPISYGCSIILRGENQENLYQLKRILLFTIYARYNLNLENNFLADEGATCEFLVNLLKSLPPNPETHSISQSLDAIEKTRKRLSGGGGNNSTSSVAGNDNLTASSIPRIGKGAQHNTKLIFGIDKICVKEFEIFNILSKAGKQFTPNHHDHHNVNSNTSISLHKNNNNNNNNDHKNIKFDDFMQLLSCSPNIFYPPQRDISMHPILKSWPSLCIPNEFLVPNFIDNSFTTSYVVTRQSAPYNYPTLFKFNELKEPKPMNQQSILYLHSLCCKDTGNQCIPYAIHRIEFYSTKTDLTLETFLKNYCFNPDKVCSVCSLSLMSHDRSFIHGRGRINISLEKSTVFLKKFANDSEIICWSSCPHCHAFPTEFTTLSMNSCLYSFGKWLEHSFYYQGISHDSSSCPHSITREHIRYFMLGNIVAAISYEAIPFYEVNLPPLRLRYYDESKEKINQSQILLLEKTIEKIYEIIQLQIDELETTLKKEDDLKHLEELKSSVNEEKQLIFKRFNDAKSRYLHEDPYELNRFKRHLFVNTSTWNSTFQELYYKRVSSSVTRRAFLSSVANRELIAKNDPIFVMYAVKSRKKKNKRNKIPSTNSSPAFNTNPSSSSTSSSSTTNSNHPKKSLLSLKSPESGLEYMPAVGQPISSRQNRLSQRYLTQQPSDIPSIQITSNHQELNTSSRYKTTNLSAKQITAPASSGTIKDTQYHQHAPSRPRGSTDNISHHIKSNSYSDLAKSTNSIPVSSSSSSNYQQITSPISIQQQPSLESNSNPNLTPGESFSPNLRNSTSNINLTQSTPALSTNNLELSSEIEENESNNITSLSLPTLNNNNINNNTCTEKNNHQNQCINTTSFKIPFGEEESQWENQSEIEFPVLGRSPRDSQRNLSSLKGGSLKLNTLDALSLILPNLSISSNPGSLNSSALRDASGLFLRDGFDNSIIVVNEKEPSSIIAYTLMSNEYKQFVQTKKAEVIKADNNSEFEEKYVPLVSDLNNNIDINFISNQHESKIKCTVTVYYAIQFEALRDLCMPEETFIQSISHCQVWDASGGKSGSSWEKTLDERFVIKKLPKVESEAFISVGPLYFKYLAKAYCFQVPTMLAKILGVFTINYRSPTKHIKQDVIIMENLFYSSKISRVCIIYSFILKKFYFEIFIFLFFKIYDLKGSLRNRLINETEDTSVLLDENLLNGNFYFYMKKNFILMFTFSF